MSVELRVPEVGESIREVVLGKWLKKPGDPVRREEGVLEIETDKISFELAAPADGVLEKCLKIAGEKAAVGEVVGLLATGAAAAAPGGPAAVPPAVAPAAPAAPTAPAGEPRVMPAARRVLAETGLSAAEVAGTGPGGRITKEDAERHAKARAAAPAPAAPAAAPGASAAPAHAAAPSDSTAREERVPMSPIRKRIAERLLLAQSAAALLTTFNEIDMSAVMSLRKEHGETFKARHGAKLGFMSFFVKAAVDALKFVPQVNARVEGDDIVYQNHYDIGIAVGGGRGLVVPILRDADALSFAEVEARIADFADRAQNNRLELSELSGGTFTISNGGIYGSLLSTPIVNPPQSGILGLHAIQDRAVVRDGEIVVRPMMYVAVTYDHRIIDGRESVAFLRRIKECIEDPSRMLVEI